MTYVVKEVFRTVQGEGHHTGTSATFIRFAGCNMWSGYEEDRVRDSKRNDAECPRWCDTDFRGGFKFDTAKALVTYADELEGLKKVPLIVLTGGEPMLQLDQKLLEALMEIAPQATIAVETNGTVMPTKFAMPDSAMETDPRFWITLSPKRPRAATMLKWAHELKLVVPAYNVDEWEDFPVLHRFVQPQAHNDMRHENNENQVARWVATNGKWRLSLQTHKILGVR